MTFRYVDQEARDGATNEAANGAAFWQRMARNVESLQEDRRPATAVALCAEEASAVHADQMRLGSPWPVKWGPLWLDIDEPVPEVLLYIRREAVELSIGAGAGSGDLIRLHATCCGPSAGDYDLPPSDPTEWQHTASATTTDTNIDLSAETRGRTGRVGVFLWTWSIVTETAEAEGDILSREAFGGLALDWTSGSVPSDAYDRWPERVLRAFGVTGSGKVSGSSQGSDFMIGYLDATGIAAGVDAVVWTAPPWVDEILSTAWGSQGGTFSIHTMGILVAQGMTVQAPTVATVDRSVFAPGQPCRAQGPQYLINEINRIGARRMRTWGAQVLPVRARRFWASGPTSLTTSYQRIAPLTWVVASPPPEDTGFRALVGLVGLLPSSGSVAVGARQLPIDIRLNVYEAAIPSTTLQFDDNESPEREIAALHEHFGGLPGSAGGWLPIAQTIWGLVELGDWGLRGGYCCELVPGVERERADWNSITWIDLVPLYTFGPGEEVEYPAVFAVEARLRGGAADAPEVALWPLSGVLSARRLDE